MVSPWEVYWCAERLEYWFYNVESGESTFSQRRACGVPSEAAVCDGDAGVPADLGGAVGDADEDRRDEAVHVSDSACHAAVAPVRDFFDLLAELPRGPKQFSKKNPQAPTSVYCRNGASIYVGGFEAARDAEWLKQAGVGLVVSVLGHSQPLPFLPFAWIRRFRFCSDRWDDADTWRMLGKVVGGAFDFGVSVLIHCMAGIHRAPMCAAGALSIVRQLSFEEAYKLIVDSGRYVEPHRFEQHVGHSAV